MRTQADHSQLICGEEHYATATFKTTGGAFEGAGTIRTSERNQLNLFWRCSASGLICNGSH